MLYPKTCCKLSLKGYFYVLFLALVVSEKDIAHINHLKLKLPPETSLETGVSNSISKD